MDTVKQRSGLGRGQVTRAKTRTQPCARCRRSIAHSSAALIPRPHRCSHNESCVGDYSVRLNGYELAPPVCPQCRACWDSPNAPEGWSETYAR